MTLHKKHTHGHVFRDEEARTMLAQHKRDSHGDAIKMHIPEGYEEAQKDAATAVSVVYVTLSQTFSGPAVYSTMTGGGDSDALPSTTSAAAAFGAQPTASSSAAALNSDEASYLAAKSSANAVSSASVAIVVPTQSSASPMTTMATSSAALLGTTSLAANAVGGTPVQATRSPTASSQAIEQTSNGMSGGAKAGLAFGIILALGLAFGLLFFCWRRRKNPNNHEEIMDEKHTSFVDAKAKSMESRNRASVQTMQSEKVPSSIRSTRTTSTAPRLSLRPVTQFLPNLSGEPARGNGNNLEVGAAGLTVARKPVSAWERRSASNQANPFDDAAVLSDKQARPDSPPNNPFDESEGKDTDAQSTRSSGSSSKHSPNGSWAGSEPATPKSTKINTAAAVPVAAAGAGNSGSPPRQPNNVHRVQLDFKPSMDDELELRSGQLVRMLHEYDDGWALCIRMDRSQQGVTPRTCLSKLPVKPRPQGPPPPAGSRPGTTNGNRRPSNPHAPNGAMYPRPLTPTQAQRERAQSATNSESPTSPTNVPARKPVPGQAM